MSMIAMVWPCNWTLSCLRIFVEVFSIRRLYYLRDWRGKRDIGNEHIRPPARGLSGGVSSHTVPHHRDQREPGTGTEEKAQQEAPLCKSGTQKYLSLGKEGTSPLLFCSHGGHRKS